MPFSRRRGEHASRWADVTGLATLKETSALCDWRKLSIRQRCHPSKISGRTSRSLPSSLDRDYRVFREEWGDMNGPAGGRLGSADDTTAAPPSWSIRGPDSHELAGWPMGATGNDGQEGNQPVRITPLTPGQQEDYALTLERLQCQRFGIKKRCVVEVPT